MSIRVLNPTEYRRSQWCLFGSAIEQMGGVRCRSNPGGAIYAAPVHAVPGSSVISGEDLESSIALRAERPFLSTSVEFALSNGLFRPVIRMDGTDYLFEVAKFAWQANLPGSTEPAITKAEWRAQGPGFYARLWTTLGRNDSVMPFEFFVAFEDKKNTHKGKVQFEVGLAGGPVPVFARFYSSEKADAGRFEFDGSVLDRQSIVGKGAFLFYSDVTPMAADVASGSLNTLLAAYQGPLVAAPVGESMRGSWHKEPFDLFEGEHAQNVARKLHAFLTRRKDPLAYVGWIGSKRPGDTGEQGGFGGWQGFDSYAKVGSRGRMPEKTIYLDGEIAAQECNRPIFFFESDGEIVLARKHPNWVSFSEGVHFDRNVSPDRLGRDKQVGGFYRPDWIPNDDEHDVSALWPAADVLANDSECSRLALEMKAQHWVSRHTLPSVKPGWSTAGPGAGRHIGRGFMNVAENYRATGNLELLEHARRRFHETIEPLFAGTLPEIPVYRVIEKDDRVFDGKKPGWICWEDGIFCMGLDAFRQVLLDTGWTTSAAAVEKIVDIVAESLLLHAFWFVGNELKFAQRISWELRGAKFPEKWYADKDFVVDDSGTDYKNWMRAVYSIGERWTNETKASRIEANKRAIAFAKWLGAPRGYGIQKYDATL